jgi:hypothetical protein
MSKAENIIFDIVKELPENIQKSHREKVGSILSDLNYIVKKIKEIKDWNFSQFVFITARKEFLYRVESAEMDEKIKRFLRNIVCGKLKQPQSIKNF